MKEALELYRDKSYLKAEKALLESGQANSLEGQKYLYLISKALRKNDLEDRFNDYFFALGEANSFEALLLLYRERQREKADPDLQARNWRPLLESLWAAGLIEEFKQTAKSFWRRIIEKKLYSRAPEIWEFVRAKLPSLPANNLSYLVYLMETGNNGEAVKIADEIISLLESKRDRGRIGGSKLELCSKTLALLESTESSAELARRALTLSRLRSRLAGKPMETGKLIEYCVLFKDDMAALVLLLEGSVLRNGLKGRLREVLLSEANSGESKTLPWKLKTLLEGNIASKPRVAKAFESEGEDGDNFGPWEPETAGEDIHDRSSRLDMGGQKLNRLSVAEKEILARIKAGDKELLDSDKSSNIARSFVGAGFYEAALALLEATGAGPQDYYLKCHALNEAGRARELADYAQELLSGELREGEDRTPFLYMLAKANLDMGMKERAIGPLTIIMGRDPNFRDAKELLKIAKA